MNRPRSFRRVTTLLLVLGLLFPQVSSITRAHAQGTPEISITGVYLTCGDAGGFGFAYSANRQFTFVVTVLSGDLVLPAADPFVGQTGTFFTLWPNQGSVNVEVVAYELDDTAGASPMLVYSDVITCVMVPDPPGDPDPPPRGISVSGAYLTCGTTGGFGFTYSANREFRFVVAVLDGDSYLLAGEPFVGQSGSFYYPWPNEGSVDIEVIAYELTDTDSENPNLAFSGVLTCVMEPGPPVETPTSVPSPTPTQSPLPTQTPEPDASPTHTPAPRPTSPPLPQPTQTPVPEPSPTPVVVSLTLELSEPSVGTYEYPYNIPIVSVNSKPGDRVRVNIAAAGKPEDWVVITVPDPKDGAPVLNAREKAAFLMMLKIVPTTGGLFFVELPKVPPTIQVVPKPPAPVKQKEPKNRGRSLTALFMGEDEDAGLSIARQVVTLAAVATVGTVTGGFLVYTYGPWGLGSTVTLGTVFLSQDPGTGTDIFHFFVGPGDEWYLPPLPPGTYVFNIETLYGEVYNFPFTLTEDPNESLVFEENEEGEWELHVVSDGTAVSSLPETGAGEYAGMPLMIWGLAAVGFGMVSVGIRFGTSSHRK